MLILAAPAQAAGIPIASTTITITKRYDSFFIQLLLLRRTFATSLGVVTPRSVTTKQQAKTTTHDKISRRDLTILPQRCAGSKRGRSASGALPNGFVEDGGGSGGDIEGAD